MAQKIKAALLEQGSWILREIETGLKPLQDIVGGLIQVVPLDTDDVTLYCNEEGKLLDLPVTAVWIDPKTGRWLDRLAGNMVAFGPADEEGDETDATEDTITILNRFLIPAVHLEKVTVLSV